MAKVILGVCGSIAAYKSAYLASLLVKKTFEVRTVMTENACRFITALTFKTLTGDYVYTGLWEHSRIDNHTHLSVWADLVVVAPATANTIANISHGFADNLLTALILSYTGPVFVFPAMHENMWNNPSTKNNIKELNNRGFHIFEPASGDLAGGKKGIGRMIEPENIISKIVEVLKRNYPALIEK